MAGLDEVKVLAIVMLENRSFDHLLGYLSLMEPKLEINGFLPPEGPPVNFHIPGTELRNDMYVNVSTADGEFHYPFHMSDEPLATDLPHDRHSVTQQLGQASGMGVFPMRGFVDAYYNVTPTRQRLADPMGFFTAAEVPMMNFFARQFAVCDRWFSSIPCDTHPNRLMSLSGETLIDRTNGLLPDNQPLLFSWLDANRIRWRVYSDDLSFFALFKKLWGDILLDHEHFRKFSQLAADVSSADLSSFPQVILIEPSFVDSPVHPDHDPNDDHPPLPMGPGEDFLRQVYQALTPPNDLQVWQHLVMVALFDEHGGFYDHVPPLSPVITPCGDGNEPFTSTGVRVPASVISPFVSPGQVYHRNLDHTAVLEFMADWLTPGSPYSQTVKDRLDQSGFAAEPGRGRLQEILNLLGAPRSLPPDEPNVVLQSARPLYGKKLARTPNEMAFEEAVQGMAQNYPNEVRQNFPALLHWMQNR